MATTSRTGINAGSLATRVHLVEEKLKSMPGGDPGGEPPDLTELTEVVDRIWRSLFSNGTTDAAGVEYTGSAFSGSPADTTVFEGSKTLVNAVFGVGGAGGASNALLEIQDGGTSFYNQVFSGVAFDYRFHGRSLGSYLIGGPNFFGGDFAAALDSREAPGGGPISALHAIFGNANNMENMLQATPRQTLWSIIQNLQDRVTQLENAA